MAEAGIKPPKKEQPATAAPPAANTVASSTTAESQPAPATQEAKTEAPAPADVPAPKKKSKNEDVLKKMVYRDEVLSPEENMAKMSRYAFVPASDDNTTASEMVEVPEVGNNTIEV